MNTNRYRIDAPGCHCQSCVDGTSTPLDRATEEQLVALLDGSADDRTGIVASGSLDGVTVRVLWQCYAKVVLPDSDANTRLLFAYSDRMSMIDRSGQVRTTNDVTTFRIPPDWADMVRRTPAVTGDVLDGERHTARPQTR